MRVTVEPAQDRGAAVRRLLPVERQSIDHSTAEQMAEGCELFDVRVGDLITGALAVDFTKPTAWVNAVADQSGQPAAAVAALEAIARARGHRRIGFSTKRPGMLRKMLAMGYGVQAAHIIKDL